ncbi:MAG: DegT/DnrJ/EryC1/StrS family aminotransferase [Proteobacteria bacterium]|nr:DegT/DnrJ/EryC1/StrS family aminotransferase [Pseudomonadota bacterium]
MAELAVKGGNPLRNISENPWPKWPVWGKEEKSALIEVLDSGVWSYNGPKEIEFNREWAKFCGTRYALAAANGTVTIQLALEALDIGFGDEVIVPGCTWQATAAAVIDVNAVPILVDIEEDTWCLDPEAVEAAITPKTRAIIPVHLYGCIANMDAIMAIAERHQLKVIEDCAHQHGSEWNGKKVGSIGHIGSFSMQLSKIMTAGEGGALTTNDTDLWIRLDALRNCGRRPENAEELVDKGAGQYGAEGDLIQSGNYRITDFQAAILVEGLRKLQSQNHTRDENAMHLNTLLAELPGVSPMKRDPRTTEQSYFNYAFRYRKSDFDDVPVHLFRKALMEEIGCTVEACYTPLNDCTLYRPLTKKRYRISEEHWKAIDPGRFTLPVCQRIFEEESVVLHHSVLMGTKADVDQIGEAIKKIKDNSRELLE